MTSKSITVSCGNCVHWNKESNWLSGQKTHECQAQRKFLAAGANWIAEEVSIETPEDFYCTLYKSRNKLKDIVSDDG